MSSVRFILCSGRAARGAAWLALLAAATGCGQRGPLYLPTEPAAANRATLPQVLTPGGPPTAPAPPLQPAPAPQPTPRSSGTGTADPVRTP